MTPPLNPVTSPTGATVSRGATDAPADAWRTPTGPVIDALHETAQLQREARRMEELRASNDEPKGNKPWAT